MTNTNRFDGSPLDVEARRICEWLDLYMMTVNDESIDTVGNALADALDRFGTEISGGLPLQRAANDLRLAIEMRAPLEDAAEQLWLSLSWLIECAAKPLATTRDLDTWILLLLTAMHFLGETGFIVETVYSRDIPWYAPVGGSDEIALRPEDVRALVGPGLFDNAFSQLCRSVAQGEAPISHLEIAARERVLLYCRPSQVVRLLLLLKLCKLRSGSEPFGFVNRLGAQDGA